MTEAPAVAYFSMEIALEPAIPTYSGGLGVLAGDTIRSSADLELPMVAVSLLHRQGYFRQVLDEEGRQSEEPQVWPVEEHLVPLDARVRVELAGRPVALRPWRYTVRGEAGGEVPVVLLDSDLPENAPEDRRLTDRLYGGDDRYRLSQEALLGIGGVRMLRALGWRRIGRFHLNEGHAALAVLALPEEPLEPGEPPGAAPAKVLGSIRRHCVFTTHTPVPAGHDRFDAGLVREVLGREPARRLAELGQDQALNLTDLALRCARFVNGVAMRHGEVSRGMFPEYPIRSITNGIHPSTWVSPPFKALFDHHIREWPHDALALRYAVSIPTRAIRWAHLRAKRALIGHVNRTVGADFELDVFTLGFARRATAYKRATLLFRDPERLAAIAAEVGPLQVVFAGKAHPADAEGKAGIEAVFRARDALRGRVAVAWLPDYGMATAARMVAGCDAWLNTPMPPLEASGTSGMKAALNGVPSLSVLDGWWLEGCVDGVTGWAIGTDHGTDPAGAGDLDTAHAESLYARLREDVLPCFYREPDRYVGIMRSAIALNASFFNTQRMVLQYLYDAYRDRPRRGQAGRAAGEAGAAGG